MGSEEIFSIRAEFAPRTKWRGCDHKFRSLCGNFGGQRGRTGAGSCDKVGGGWLFAQHVRIEAEQNELERVALAAMAGRATEKDELHAQDQKNIEHSSQAAIRSRPRSEGSGRSDTHNDRKNPHGKGGVVAPTTVTGRGRSMTHSSAKKAGSINVVNKAVKRAVHAAAIESVKYFLGDFKPKVRQSAKLTTALEAIESGGNEGTVNKTPPVMSKWAAIGRAGKLSARAVAVCAEEVKSFFNVIIFKTV